MGIMQVLAGTNRRDQLTEKALSEARTARSQGHREFTVTVHSTYGGAALLPRLSPFVVSQLQANGFAVTNVTTDAWSYNAHITCKAT